MDQKDLDRIAAAGNELPEGLSGADTLYFLCKRALYQYAASVGMPKEQGKRESAKIREIAKCYRLDDEYVQACARRTIAVEQAATEYRKAEDDAGRLDAAGRLIEALDGVPVGKPDGATYKEFDG